VLQVEDVFPGFHAQFHACGKSYRYRMVTTQVMPPFERHYAWHSPEPKRIELMREAASMLVGRHDFASFQARGSFVKDTVRTIHSLELTERDGSIVVECDGDGFLRHMVRSIVGTLAEIGTGLRPPSIIREIIDARDRSAGGASAPAHGLTLVKVNY
jgi:tRNA pseudouridine38-40 synthase